MITANKRDIRQYKRTKCFCWKQSQFSRTIFPRHAPGSQRIKHHFLLSIDFLYWNIHLWKDSVQPHLKGLYQVLLTNPCATELQADSWIYVSHLKETRHHDSCELTIKTSRNWSRWQLISFPRWWEQASISSFPNSLLFSLHFFLGTTISLSAFPNALQKGETFLNAWSIINNFGLDRDPRRWSR